MTQSNSRILILFLHILIFFLFPKILLYLPSTIGQIFTVLQMQQSNIFLKSNYSKKTLIQNEISELILYLIKCWVKYAIRRSYCPIWICTCRKIKYIRQSHVMFKHMKVWHSSPRKKQNIYANIYTPRILCKLIIWKATVWLYKTIT